MIPQWTSPRTVSIRQADWHSNISFAPTPEQLRDHGQVDGIPIVTAEEVARRCAAQLREIAKYSHGYKARQSNVTKSIPVRLVPIRGGASLQFPTMKTAAKQLAMTYLTHRRLSPCF